MKQVFLLPGECHASREPTLITTLLGSCVGVALYDPSTKIGGLNHFLLPTISSGEEPSYRYGESAIPSLIEWVTQLGAKPQCLQAKIYGGAAVLDNLFIGAGIGKLNIQIAREILASYRIPVLTKEVGGTSGRKITFNTSTFEIRCFLSAELKKGAA